MNKLDYDLGYYEGYRNCISELIRGVMNGEEVGDIIEHLAQLRDEARAQYDESNKLDDGEDW